MTTEILRARGLKPSTPAKVAHRLLVAVRAGSGSSAQWVGHPKIAGVLQGPIRDAADLGPFTPRLRVINGRKGALDQGPTSACTWHSEIAALSTACAAQGIVLPWLPSPDLGYKAMRALERAMTTPTGEDLTPLQDTGGEMADVETIAGEYGVVPLGAPPLDGRYSDVDPATVNDEPNPILLQEAGLTLVTGPYKIDPTDPAISDIVAAAIQANAPVKAGFYCDMAFETAAAGVVRTAPVVANLPGEGGHAVYLSAFRTNVFSKREFRVENSWGDSWCENGTCWVDELWLAACWELWPVFVAHVAPRSLGRGLASAQSLRRAA